MSVNLSVNINKFATLRNARGGNNPDILVVAADAERFGADGITVHPRPDERHIRYADVIKLKPIVKTELNIEGYPDEKFLQLVEMVKPEQVTLVPDAPDVLTSNAGWNTIKHLDYLKEIIERIKMHGIRVSIFLDANEEMVEAAYQSGADRIELYTESYAVEYKSNPDKAIENYIKTANLAGKYGLGVNAGHDLDINNLQFFADNIPGLLEVSIGHALICDALYLGFHNAIQLYKSKLNG